MVGATEKVGDDEVDGAGVIVGTIDGDGDGAAVSVGADVNVGRLGFGRATTPGHVAARIRCSKKAIIKSFPMRIIVANSSLTSCNTADGSFRNCFDHSLEVLTSQMRFVSDRNRAETARSRYHVVRHTGNFDTMKIRAIKKRRFH